MQSIKFTENPTVRGKIARGELYSKQLRLAYKISCYTSNSLFTLSYFFLTHLNLSSITIASLFLHPQLRVDFLSRLPAPIRTQILIDLGSPACIRSLIRASPTMLQQYTVDRHIVVWGMLRKLTSLTKLEVFSRTRWLSSNSLTFTQDVTQDKNVNVSCHTIHAVNFAQLIPLIGTNRNMIFFVITKSKTSPAPSTIPRNRPS